MTGCSNRARGGRSESLSTASVGSPAVVKFANQALPQIKEMIDIYVYNIYIQQAN